MAFHAPRLRVPGNVRLGERTRKKKKKKKKQGRDTKVVPTPHHHLAQTHQEGSSLVEHQIRPSTPLFIPPLFFLFSPAPTMSATSEQQQQQASGSQQQRRSTSSTRPAAPAPREKRLIVVSNRLPVTINKDADGTYQYKVSSKRVGLAAPRRDPRGGEGWAGKRPEDGQTKEGHCKTKGGRERKWHRLRPGRKQGVEGPRKMIRRMRLGGQSPPWWGLGLLGGSVVGPQARVPQICLLRAGLSPFGEKRLG